MAILGADNGNSGGLLYSTPAMALGGFSFSSVNGGFNFDMPLATVAMFNNQALDFVATNSKLNRQFIEASTQTANASAAGTEKQLFGFLNGGLSKIYNSGNTAQNYAFQASISSQQYALEQAKVNVENTKAANSGWCFITTAICELDGLPDDCETLQTFRKFRDDYMMQSVKGCEMVADYYKRAPEILDRFKKMPDGGAAYLRILKRQYLDLAYSLIKKGDNESALYTYQKMVIAADELSKGQYK